MLQYKMDKYLIKKILIEAISQYDGWRIIPQIKILFPKIYKKISHLRPTLNEAILIALDRGDFETVDRYLSKGATIPSDQIVGSDNYLKLANYYGPETNNQLTKWKRVCSLCLTPGVPLPLSNVVERKSPVNSYLLLCRNIYVCKECLGCATALPNLYESRIVNFIVTYEHGINSRGFFAHSRLSVWETVAKLSVFMIVQYTIISILKYHFQSDTLEHYGIIAPFLCFIFALFGRLRFKNFDIIWTKISPTIDPTNPTFKIYEIIHCQIIMAILALLIMYDSVYFHNHTVFIITHVEITLLSRILAFYLWKWINEYRLKHGMIRIVDVNDKPIFGEEYIS